jgi:hypothetical protein
MSADQHVPRTCPFRLANARGGRDGISGVNLGERMITKLIIDVVLFSCMFTFVTGIVLAAAHVLG